jgi:hypothetical protein
VACTLAHFIESLYENKPFSEIIEHELRFLADIAALNATDAHVEECGPTSPGNGNALRNEC